jgi:hypothetical protein
LAHCDRKLRDVFGRLRKHNLKLQPDKREFLRKEVTFLRHKISDFGVKPDICKLESQNYWNSETAEKLLRMSRVLEKVRSTVQHSSSCTA